MSDYTKEELEDGIKAARWALQQAAFPVQCGIENDFDEFDKLYRELKCATKAIDRGWKMFCKARDGDTRTMRPSDLKELLPEELDGKLYVKEREVANLQIELDALKKENASLSLAIEEKSETSAKLAEKNETRRELIRNLQRDVQILTEENGEFRESNEKLRGELETYRLRAKEFADWVRRHQ